ncbi:MAG: hypothetical protein SGBAC_008025 [Bacillariaceae sp.]
MSVDREISSIGSKSSDSSLIKELAVTSKGLATSDEIVNGPDSSFASNQISAYFKYAQPDVGDGGQAHATNKNQMRRLQMVSSQAFLFLEHVGVYETQVCQGEASVSRETRAWAFRRDVLGDGLPQEQSVPTRQKEEPADAVSKSGSGSGEIEHCTRTKESTASSNGIDKTNQLVPLPKSTMMSSSIASLDDLLDGHEEPKTKAERTKGAFESESCMPRVHFHSSLEYMGRGLEAISELSESFFDPFHHSPLSSGEDQFESSERRWISSTTANASPTSSERSRFDDFREENAAPQSCMGLVAPRRLESSHEIFDGAKEDDATESEDMYDLDKYEEKKEMDIAVDTPASIPLRRTSISKSLDSRSFHSYSSSISSSCSLIGSSDDDDSESHEDDEDYYDYTYQYDGERFEGVEESVEVI